VSVAFPRFKIPDPVRVTTRLLSLEPAGKMCRPTSSIACATCKRRITGLGRVVAPATIVCDSAACQWTRPGLVTALFPTAYGRALPRSTIATFARTLDAPGGASFIERQAIVDRARLLAEGYHDLVRWQIAFDLYERTENSDGYSNGRVQYLPPRLIEDVTVLRLPKKDEDPSKMILRRDPTENLPEEARWKIRQIYRGERAERGEEVPF
jgi:hypothetical protein